MASTKRKQREQLPGWAWMLFGLCIGLGVALFVYLQSNELRLSDSLRELTSEMRRAEPEPARATETSQPAASTQAAPAADDGDTGDGDSAGEASDEPGLSFYTRLRESEVIVGGAPPETDTGVRLPRTIELQAGSFPTEQGADTRQAALALVGVNSRIDRAVVNDTMHYRVIIGPLNERDEIDRISRRLDREEIEYFRREVRTPD